MRYYMTEHCGAKAALSGTMGYALGGLMGLFLHGATGESAQVQSKG